MRPGETAGAEGVFRDQVTRHPELAGDEVDTHFRSPD